MAAAGWLGTRGGSPSRPHSRFGCPSVLKCVYFKGDKVLGCRRVTAVPARPLLKVPVGAGRRRKRVGGSSRASSRTHTPSDLAPVCREPSAWGRGHPAARAHCPGRRRDGHLPVPAGSFFVRCPAHARAGRAPHVLRPFPLAEAPNEIKDLLQRGGGKGNGLSNLKMSCLAPGLGSLAGHWRGWVQAAPGRARLSAMAGLFLGQHEVDGCRGGSRAPAG